MHTVEAEGIIKEFNSLSLNLDEFINNLEFKIIKYDKDCIHFDLKNCHPALANALRRILISKIPTVAIEYCSIFENNTIFPDEYLAHRIGLVPIRNCLEETFLDEENFKNVLNFRLRKYNDTDEIISLISDDIEFIPLPGQQDLDSLVKKGVLIAKLAPGNEINMTMKAILGTGEEHAKWSPVSLCSYKIMPRIILEDKFTGEDAVELKACFSPGVIEIKDSIAYVSNPRLESMSREVFRHDKFMDKVKILRESGWFCFTVESTGEDPLVLVKKAIGMLIKSCKDLKEEVENLSAEY